VIPPALAGADGSDPFPRAGYAWYVVGVLTLANASAFVDRQVLGLLVAPIRRDLGITDTQMGVLYGLAFALFYTLLGIPLGRLADRGSRRAIVAMGIAAWSVMTVLCGVARTYEQLLLARFGVAIGEAALAAPALSLIADYFAPSRRATALSVYSLGIYLGAGLANLAGAAVLARLDGHAVLQWPIVGTIRPWQSVFVIVGLPGLIVAMLMATVREPRRRETGQPNDALAFSVIEVLRHLRGNRAAFLCHNLGYALFAMVNFATAAWLPTHLIRTYGWSAAQAGLTLGTLTVTVGVAGVVVRTPCLPGAARTRSFASGSLRPSAISRAARRIHLPPPRRSPSQRSCPTTSSPRSRSVPRSQPSRRSPRTGCARRSAPCSSRR